MATPKWNRVDFRPVSIPQSTGRQQSLNSPVNNFDLALGRFREVLGDYGAIQDRKTNTELARRTLGMTDPDAIRQAINDGSLVSGLDPISVTENAYLNADARAQAILEERAQDLRNRVGEQALTKDTYNFGRQQATDAARDAVIGVQQRLVQAGARGDVRGQGDILAGIDSSTLTPEALDALSKRGITDIGVPTRGQDIQIRGQDLNEAASQRNYAVRMLRLNQEMQALQAQQQSSELDARAQQDAFDIAQLPNSMQGIALSSRKEHPELFARTAAHLDRYKQGRGIPVGDNTSSLGRGRPFTDTVNSPSGAQAIRDDVVHAPRAPISAAETRAASLIRQAARFDNTFPVAEPFQSAPANATEDQAISFYLKTAGNSQHSENNLRKGWKQLETELKERDLDKRFSTAEKLQLLDQGMERNPDWASGPNILFGRGGGTTFNIENVSGIINDVGRGSNAARSVQRSNVTNSVAEVRTLVREFDEENKKLAQLSNDIARANISDREREYYNQALREQANVVGVLQQRLNNTVNNAQQLMEGGGLIKPPKDRAYVPPSRKELLDQFRREREEAERLRVTPTNVR